MNFKYFNFRRCAYLVSLATLCVMVCSSSISIAFGQKKPSALKQDADADDTMLCKQDNLKDSEFCTLYVIYNANKDSADPATAKKAEYARNDMIEIIRGQVDTYYKDRKDGRRFKIKIFQTIVDFLEIGGALTVSIINGTRAKSIIGAAIGALQGGRTSYNKNFDILETQILINKMNTNRATVVTDIVVNTDKPVRAKKATDAYTWTAAKNDLRRYLYAGTYDNALDTLVRQTGAEVANAEEKLRIVEKGLTVGEVSPEKFDGSRKTAEIFVNLDSLVISKPAETTTLLQAIVTSLINKGGWIKAELKAAGVTPTSSGIAILAGIRAIKSQALDEPNGDELIDAIDKTIIEITGKK